MAHAVAAVVAFVDVADAVVVAFAVVVAASDGVAAAAEYVDQ